MEIKMKTIKSLSEIDFLQQETVNFTATVLDLQDEGDESKKRPLRFGLKLEESGETIIAISWTYGLLEDIKELTKSAEISEFEAATGTFREQQQFRVGNLKKTGLQSARKVVRKADVAAVKREIQAIVNKFIKTTNIKLIVDQFIINNPKFYEWPAATKIHHAYEGGLASHSLMVTKHVISLWENYQGENLDIEILVAGALLHDIGKIYEYTKDGEKTTFGSLIPHLVSGSEEIAKFCFSIGIDSNRDTKILMLKHILLSHHAKMEYGAAVTPATLEAILISRADEIDATFEAVSGDLSNLAAGDFTDRLRVLDGDKALKWY